jgi:glycolate oxidase
VEPFHTATEIIAKAHETLSAATWAYVAGAAESETTKRRNRDAIEEWAFRPRVLRNVSAIDISTRLMGSALRIPVLLAPIGSLQTIVTGGAIESARAAAEFGTLPIISSVTQPSLEETAKATSSEKWFQLYIRGDFDWIMGQVHRVRDAGYRTLVLTVDSACYSIRERQIQHRWVPPSKSAGTSGEEYQALLDWETVERIRERTDLPIVLKGVQTAEDAERAVQLGINVLYLSNHGGRQLDHARGALSVLVEVAERLNPRLPIVVDGGFMRGSDVLKAVALGASAVAIGRMQAYALGANGATGLVRLLEILENEMRCSMAMIGATRLTQLNRSYLERTGPPAGGPDPFPLLPDSIRL